MQRARLVALPTPANGVRPAWETIFVDANPVNVTSYIHFVDAATGQVLVRKNIVEHSHPAADTFSGSVPLDRRGLRHAARARGRSPPARRVGAIAVSVEATLPVNDVVVVLKRDGAIVASQDTATSPEVLVYAPGGNVPAGTYTVDVCDFVRRRRVDRARHLQRADRLQPGRAARPARASRIRRCGRSSRPTPRLGNQTFPWNYPNTDTRRALVLGEHGRLPAAARHRPER